MNCAGAAGCCNRAGIAFRLVVGKGEGGSGREVIGNTRNGRVRNKTCHGHFFVDFFNGGKVCQFAVVVHHNTYCGVGNFFAAEFFRRFAAGCVRAEYCVLKSFVAGMSCRHADTHKKSPFFTLLTIIADFSSKGELYTVFFCLFFRILIESLGEFIAANIFFVGFLFEFFRLLRVKLAL